MGKALGHRHFRALSPGPVSVRTGAQVHREGPEALGAKPWGGAGEEGRPPGTLLLPKLSWLQLSTQGAAGSPRALGILGEGRLLVGVRRHAWVGGEAVLWVREWGPRSSG